MAYDPEDVDAAFFVAHLRDLVEHRGELPHTPVDTEYGTVLGVARIRTLDAYRQYGSILHALTTLTLTTERDVAIEHHVRHTILTESGAQRGGHIQRGDDSLCRGYLVTEDEVIRRWSGREQGRYAILDMFRAPWLPETARPREVRRDIQELLLDLTDARPAEDLFHPDNTEAHRVALDTIGDDHLIMDRAAWLAVTGLRRQGES